MKKIVKIEVMVFFLRSGQQAASSHHGPVHVEYQNLSLHNTQKTGRGILLLHHMCTRLSCPIWSVLMANTASMCFCP